MCSTWFSLVQQHGAELTIEWRLVKTSEVHAKWPQLNNQHNNYKLLTMCCLHVCLCVCICMWLCMYACLYKVDIADNVNCKFCAQQLIYLPRKHFKFLSDNICQLPQSVASLSSGRQQKRRWWEGSDRGHCEIMMKSKERWQKLHLRLTKCLRCA